jgi:hypothetical protein
MKCDACFEAQSNPYTGLFTVGCHGCEIRRVSSAPAHARDKYYHGIGNPDQRAKFASEVATEYKRRQALVAARRADIVLREIA